MSLLAGVASAQNASRERSLPLTNGGFIQGGNEHQKVSGICTTDDDRTVLHCDIYNGLPDWKVTGITIRIAWLPYSDDDVRDFKQHAFIEPMTTVPVTVRLGIRLPDDTTERGHKIGHWSWLIVGATAVPH